MHNLFFWREAGPNGKSLLRILLCVNTLRIVDNVPQVLKQPCLAFVWLFRETGSVTLQVPSYLSSCNHQQVPHLEKIWLMPASCLCTLLCAACFLLSLCGRCHCCPCLRAEAASLGYPPPSPHPPRVEKTTSRGYDASALCRISTTGMVSGCC